MIRNLWVITLLIATAGCAWADPPRLQDDLPYQASGSAVGCRLAEYPNISPDFRKIPKNLAEAGKTVFLRPYLWFPNPLSSPEVVVGVTERSDFILEYREVAGDLIEVFEFAGIEPGVYICVLDSPIEPVRKCQVRLLVDGKQTGEIESRTHEASYHW